MVQQWWWSVRAESGSGQLLTFGLHADGRDRAYLTALERLPWAPHEISLTPVPMIPGRGGVTFTEHQAHGKRREDCRFCAAAL